MATSAPAEEKLPMRKAGSATYSNITVTKVTATNIFFISDRGLANAALKNLDPAWQNRQNPKVVYIGPELEFNLMTQCFYTNWSVPKKKLNESEMLEINRHYRIIGQDEDKLAGSQN